MVEKGACELTSNHKNPFISAVEDVELELQLQGNGYQLQIIFILVSRVGLGLIRVVLMM